MEVPQDLLVYLEPAYSRDGRFLATGVGKNACQVRDARTGRELGPPLALGATPSYLAFSPDGQLLAGGDSEGGIRLWNTATGQPVVSPLKHKQPVNGLQFSPDGRRLLVTGGDMRKPYGEACVWDVATGQPVTPALEISGAVHTASFSPDGTTFATGAFQLALRDSDTGRRIWTAPVFEVTKQLAFTPDGRHVLARQLGSNWARTYDARTGEPSGPHLRHPQRLSQFVLSPDGRLVLTSSAGGRARLWDAGTGLAVGPGWGIPVSAGDTGAVIGCFTPDGRGVLLADGGAIARWDIPGPIEGNPERVRLAIEAGLRLSLDPFGGEKGLYPTWLPVDVIRENKAKGDNNWFGPDPIEPVRKRLAELGGPPGFLRR